MQVRKKISLLLLVVFAIFLSIAVFHPLSHGLVQHKNGHADHECSICLWLNSTVIILLSAVIFDTALLIVNFIVSRIVTPRIKDFFYGWSSRAPPVALS